MNRGIVLFWERTKSEIVLLLSCNLDQQGGYHSIYFHTNTFQSYFSLSEWWCVLLIYNSFLFHATWEELSFIKSNQQKCRFYISPQLLKTWDNVELCKVNFWYQQIIHSMCCEHITCGVDIYLYGCVSLLVPVCAVCLCLCVWYKIRVLAKHHVICYTSVNWRIVT